MYTVRCLICRQQMPTLRLLIYHYVTRHSKSKIIKELLKCSSLQSTPNLLKHKNKAKKVYKKPKRLTRVNPEYPKTETLFLNENIHILCGQNEIIIGDSKSSTETEFSFTNTSSDSKENYVPFKDSNSNIVPKKKIKFDVGCRKASNRRNIAPSVSSEDIVKNSQLAKRKVKPKRKPLSKMRHYRINITKLRDQQSLGEENGEFYMCHCREKYSNGRKVLQRSDLRIVTWDADSRSYAGKNLLNSSVEMKAFCNKCGNGYNSESELVHHMQVHEAFCRLCNEHFVNEYVFKEHMRMHIFKVYMCHVCGKEFSFRDLLQIHFECHMEDRTFETVLDMEEEYTMHRYEFLNMNYTSSINSILCYLSENHGYYYYNYKFMKVICEICCNEVFICDYEQHLQNVHYCGF